MRVITLFLFSVAATFSVAGLTIEWKAGETPDALGDAVSFTYGNGKVRSMSVATSGETVVMTGDPIGFAENAEVALSGNGRMVFSNKVVSAGGTLAVMRPDSQLTWAGESGISLPVTDDPFQGIVVLSGVLLDELDVVSSVFDGKKSDLSGLAKPYFVSRSEGRVECQLQSQVRAQYNAGTTQSVKLMLVQDGDDVRASIAWAKTNGSAYGDYRGRLDFSEATLVNSQTLAVISDPVVDNLTMVRKETSGKGVVVFAGSAEVSTFSVAGGMTVEMDSALAGGEIGSSVDVSTGSRFVFRNSDGGSVTGSLSGYGDVVFENDERHSFFRPGFFYTQEDVDTDGGYHTTSMVFMVNADLSKVTNISAIVGCGTKGVLPIAKDGYVLKTKTATSQYWQIQGLDTSTGANFMRCADIEFTQQGKDIWVKYANARQGFGSQGVYLVGDPQKCTASKNQNSAAVYVCDIKIFFSEPVVPGDTVFSSENAMDAGDLIVGSQSRLSVASCSALPQFGRMIVMSNAVAALDFGLSQDYTGKFPHISSFHVRKGGVLMQRKKFSVGYMEFVWNDGGVVEVSTGESSFDNTLNHLMFADGARLSVNTVRCGGRHMGRWDVAGTQPSHVSVKKQLYLYSHIDSTEADPKVGNFHLSVSDVTGDDEVDFTFDGVITTPANPAHTNITFIKSGSGTWLMNGAFTVAGGLQIFDGYVRAGVSGVFSPSQNVKMEGGHLSFAAGTENTIGSLSISHSVSTIEIDEGAKLTVENIGRWIIGQIDGRLRIEGPYVYGRQQVVFPMLTAEQHKAVTWNGERISQKPDGTIILRPRNLRIIVR